jgi:hypothetical protein
MGRAPTLQYTFNHWPIFCRSPRGRKSVFSVMFSAHGVGLGKIFQSWLCLTTKWQVIHVPGLRLLLISWPWDWYVTLLHIKAHQKCVFWKFEKVYILEKHHDKNSTLHCHWSSVFNSRMTTMKYTYNNMSWIEGGKKILKQTAIFQIKKIIYYMW